MVHFDQYREIIASIAVDVVRLTILKYLWFIVPLLVFGLLVHLLNQMTFNAVRNASLSTRSFVIATGWLGVPVHEIGHTVFAVLFGHKINRVKLFDPHAQDGQPLGYLRNSYNPNSPTHVFGDFFVRVGPLLFGSLVLLVAFRLLVPAASEVIEQIATVRIHYSLDDPLLDVVRQEAHSLAGVTTRTASTLLAPSNYRAPQFWLFLYLAVCVSCYMSLSPNDIEPLGSIAGVVPAGILLVNTVLVVLEYLSATQGFSILGFINVSAYTVATLKCLGIMTAILTIALTLAFATFLICYTMATAYGLMRQGRIPNPFAG